MACQLAGLGLRAAWVSAVGDDPFGRAVTGFVAEHGVDVSGVVVDPDRPTGVYFKELPRQPGALLPARVGGRRRMGPDLLGGPAASTACASCTPAGSRPRCRRAASR